MLCPWGNTLYPLLSTDLTPWTQRIKKEVECISWIGIIMLKYQILIYIFATLFQVIYTFGRYFEQTGFELQRVN